MSVSYLIQKTKDITILLVLVLLVVFLFVSSIYEFIYNFKLEFLT